MVTVAAITDGTSNTLSYSEARAAAKRGPWNIRAYSSLFNTNNPPNDNGGAQPASYHPGGVNVGFVDGSARFIKNSINTWPFTTLSFAQQFTWLNYSCVNLHIYFNMTDIVRPGVWQALSTKANGEVISSDSY